MTLRTAGLADALSKLRPIRLATQLDIHSEGMTPRNRILFLERGHAYVYLVYGVSFLLNVTSERAGVGAGVLLRAVEPLDGFELMDGMHRRKQWANIGRGPGRLTKAMKIDLRHNGLDLCSASSSLWLAVTARKTGPIGKSVRIGLTRGASRLLRFYERGNKYVSGPSVSAHQKT